MFQSNQLERFSAMEKGEVVYLVADDSGKVVGHLLLKLHGIPTEPNFPNMNDIYVLEEMRNIGIGTELIKTAENITKEKGFSKISLAVNPTLNPEALSLYERLWYKQTSTETYLDGVYDGDEDWVVDMVKELYFDNFPS